MNLDTGKKTEYIDITYVCRQFYPAIGGVETVAKQLTDSLHEKNFSIKVFTCSNDYKSEKINNVFVKRHKFPVEFKSNPLALGLFFSLFQHKTDVLHYHHPFIFSAIMHFLARPKYKKLVTSYHSDIIGYNFLMKIFGSVYMKFLEKTDKIILLSYDLLESSKILQKFRDKCEVISYGIDLEKFNNPNLEKIENIKQKYNNKKILLFVGRLVFYKGIPYLVEAMKNVSNDAILLIVGDGPMEEEIKALIEKYNLENKVFMLGRASDDELISYFQACDIFVLPSILPSEAFGIVQLEAMSCEKPVINMRLNNGVNYVSINNETGLTVEPANASQLSDAINLLVQDENLRIKLGKNARARVEEKFDIKKIKEKYIQFYENFICG
jgi:glycosyltransferase involved in cell wall biosynthesis